MAEVLVEFDTSVSTRDGRSFRPRACGRESLDGRWEGWLEFVPADAGDAVRSERETVQPNRADLRYWAEGLTQVYLEGALERALAQPAPAQVEQLPSTPAFSGPRPAGGGSPAAARAVLDPFEVYAQGPDVLRRQLAAVDVGHLRAIALAYGLIPAGAAENAERDDLTSAIMAAARSAASAR